MAAREAGGRAWRVAVAGELAECHCGVAHRRDLRAAGVTRFDVRTEIAAGRWSPAGRHTVVIGGTAPCGGGRLWHAVWESGSGAVLDGAAALLASGLTGFDPEVIDISVPVGTHPRTGGFACAGGAACRRSSRRGCPGFGPSGPRCPPPSRP